MKSEFDKVAISFLTLISFFGFMIFPFLAHFYTFEAWIQYCYYFEGTETKTPVFLAIQSDLWWLYFLFPAAVAISFAALLIGKINIRTQTIALYTLIFIFCIVLIACLHTTFSIWLSKFGAMC